MVVYEPHFEGGIPLPTENQSPLIIHADAMPTLQPAPERLQSIGRWHPQIVQSNGVVQDV